MLKRIHIDNYKCLTNFDLCFGELTLLLGANGCGKSAVFEVVGKLRDFIRGDARVGELFPPPTSRTGAKRPSNTLNWKSTSLVEYAFIGL